MVDQPPTENSKVRATAAYVPFKTFLSAVDSLQHGIPRQIDRTIWRNQSGVIQSQILMAFRFFGLVDEEDKPTPALHRMVDQPGKRTEQMRSLLLHSYRDLIDHDLTKMTPKMLEEAMDGYNVSGDTRRRALTFFLQAAKFADMPMHPMLTRHMRGPGSRRRRQAAKPQAAPAAESFQTPADSANQSRNLKTLELRSGGRISLSVVIDMFAASAEDRQFVFDLIDMLNEYEHKAQPSTSGE